VKVVLEFLKKFKSSLRGLDVPSSSPGALEACSPAYLGSLRAVLGGAKGPGDCSLDSLLRALIAAGVALTLREVHSCPLKALPYIRNFPYVVHIRTELKECAILKEYHIEGLCHI